MSDFSKQFSAQVAEREQARMGDIYDFCEKRDCDKRFCQAFETRMLLFPMTQTQIFMDKSKTENRKKWKIYLEAFIVLRPNDSKTDERKKALKLLEPL